MVTTLELALKQYLDLIRALFAHTKRATEASTDPHLRRSADQQLFSLVEAAEGQQKFRALVEATRDEFSADSMEKTIGGLWDSPVQNFFRQSRIYQGIFQDERIDDTSLVASYRKALQRRTCQVTYFTPLEFVEFDQDVLDFGDFQIRCLSEAELDRLLKQDVRRVFYPGTVVDSRKLGGYWFVEATETFSVGPLQGLEVPIGPQVTLQYSTFPKLLERIFRRLVLYAFPNPLHGSPQSVGVKKPIDPWAGFFRFGVPFVIRVSDAMTESPQAAPDVSTLAMEPDVLEDTDGTLVQVDRAPIDYRMDAGETATFLSFIKKVNGLLGEIEPSLSEWRFIDVAMSFLVKAYFCEFSNGFEQLLWHIVAVEAALGESGAGVTERLKRRVSAVLAHSEDEAKQIRDEFYKLYNLRNSLVHGSAELGAKEVFLGHLGQARDIARRVVHWMLCYLAHIRRTCSGTSAGLPRRDDILLSLDIDNPARARLSALLTTLPDGFPHIPDW